MKKHKPSRSVSDLVALVDAMIAYWKSIAESNFKKANPNSDSTEFEQVWPNVLNNFFLAETVRTTKRLRAFSPEGRDN
jgi:hypothetical protein